MKYKFKILSLKSIVMNSSIVLNYNNEAINRVFLNILNSIDDDKVNIYKNYFFRLMNELKSLS
jgi:hypothetical protein